MKRLTLSELAQFDGEDGRAKYVAYKGSVYDVSNSFLWKGGKHQGLHQAGRDLTGELERAPHGQEFLEQFPIVGQLME